MTHSQLRHDPGNVTAFVAVVAIALVMMAGLAWDGGQIISTHAEARSHAAKAARAGAQEIDITTLRQTGATVLDPASAAAAAQDYLAAVGVDGATAQVEVDGATVTVTITATQPMRILPLPDRVITVSQSADAVDGPLAEGASVP